MAASATPESGRIRSSAARLEGQRHQAGARRDQGQAEAPGKVMREAGRAHLRDGQPAGRQHQRRRLEAAAIRLHPEAHRPRDTPVMRWLSRGDRPPPRRIRPAASRRLPGRAVAEQLPQRLLVPGDAVPLDQRDEVVLGVAGQRRFGEMRIGREEAVRRAMQVGEVAAPAAGDQDLLARLVGMVEQQHPAAAPAGG